MPRSRVHEREGRTLEFDHYSIALLTLRPDAPELDDEAAAALQDAHMAHLAGLHEAGHLLAAGPLSDEKFRGLTILNVEPWSGRASSKNKIRPSRSAGLRQGDPLDRARRRDHLLSDSIPALVAEAERLTPELHLVPRRNRRHFQQRAIATPRIHVGELSGLILPGDLEAGRPRPSGRARLRGRRASATNRRATRRRPARACSQ